MSRVRQVRSNRQNSADEEIHTTDAIAGMQAAHDLVLFGCLTRLNPIHVVPWSVFSHGFFRTNVWLSTLTGQ